MDFKSAAEDLIREQLMKQVQKLIDDKLQGKVPPTALDPAIEELKKQLDDVNLF